MTAIISDFIHILTILSCPVFCFLPFTIDFVKGFQFAGNTVFDELRAHVSASDGQVVEDQSVAKAVDIFHGFIHAHHAGMIVRITPRLIGYSAKELKRMFQEELENEQLTDFSRIILVLNVSVTDPRIHKIVLPRFSQKVVSNDTVEVTLRGGAAKLLASYRAVYRTTREGLLEANMSNFVVNIKFRVSTTFAGKLLMEDAICNAEVRDVEVLLTPKLLNQIDEGLRDEIADTVSIAICQTIEQYMSKFEERFNKLIRTPLIDIQINNKTQRLLLDTTMNSNIVLKDDYFDFPIAGSPPAHNGLTHLTQSPEDRHKMVYLYISEYVINSFLKQLDTFGDLHIALHEIVEFRSMLELDCSQESSCIGDLLEDSDIYNFETGQMDAWLHAPPEAKIFDRYALVDLKFRCSISYSPKDMDTTHAKLLTFEWTIRLRVNDSYLDARLNKDKSSTLSIPEIEIQKISIDTAKPNVEMIENHEKHLLRMIQMRKNSLQKILSEKIDEIKIPQGEMIETVSMIGYFRRHTLTIGTGVIWSNELVQHFSLFS